MDYEVQGQIGLLRLVCSMEFAGLHEMFLSFGFRRLLQSIAAALQYQTGLAELTVATAVDSD